MERFGVTPGHAELLRAQAVRGRLQELPLNSQFWMYLLSQAHWVISLFCTKSLLVSSSLSSRSWIVTNSSCSRTNLIHCFRPTLCWNSATRLFESVLFGPPSSLALCSTPLASEKYIMQHPARALSRQNGILKSVGRQTQISQKSLFPLVAQ